MATKKECKEVIQRAIATLEDDIVEAKRLVGNWKVLKKAVAALPMDDAGRELLDRLEGALDQLDGEIWEYPSYSKDLNRAGEIAGVLDDFEISN